MFLSPSTSSSASPTNRSVSVHRHSYSLIPSSPPSSSISFLRFLCIIFIISLPSSRLLGLIHSNPITLIIERYKLIAQKSTGKYWRQIHSVSAVLLSLLYILYRRRVSSLSSSSLPSAPGLKHFQTEPRQTETIVLRKKGKRKHGESQKQQQQQQQQQVQAAKSVVPSLSPQSASPYLSASPNVSLPSPSSNLSSVSSSPSIPSSNSLPPQPEEGPEADLRRLKFLSQTKYVACLGVERFFELFPQVKKVLLRADQTLFIAQQETEAGMYIVSRGKLGIFAPEAMCFVSPPHKKTPTQNHSQQRNKSFDTMPSGVSLGTGEPMAIVSPGESVGEFSLISSLPSSSSSPSSSFFFLPKLSCAALEDSEVYFLSRTVFDSFTLQHPLSLIDFVRTAVARQWRIASYVLEHFLEIPPDSRQQVQGPIEAARVECEEIEIRKQEEMKKKRGEMQSSDGQESFTTSLSSSSSSSSSAIPSWFARFKGIKLLSLSAGDILFSINEEADSLYVVNTGSLQAFNSSHQECAIIPSGCVVGGISFFGSTVRGEMMRCLEDCTVYEYTRETIEQLILEDPLLLLPIVRAVGRQLAPVCQQFFELGLDTRFYRSGHLIFRQGEEADAVYLTISGRIRMVAHPDAVDINEFSTIQHNSIASSQTAAAATNNSSSNDTGSNGVNHHDQQSVSSSSSSDSDLPPEQYLFEVGRGETFGEDTNIASLNSSSSAPLSANASSSSFHSMEIVYRPYTAVCIRDTEAVRISNISFMNLFEKNPRAMLRFSRNLTKRLNQLASRARVGNTRQKQSDTNIATICLIRVGGGEAAEHRHLVREFGLRLMSELVSYGPVLWVNRDTIEKELGKRTSDNLNEFVHRSRCARWLSEQEESNRFILFEADEIQDEKDIRQIREQAQKEKRTHHAPGTEDEEDSNGTEDISVLLKSLSRPSSAALSSSSFSSSPSFLSIPACTPSASAPPAMNTPFSFVPLCASLINLK